MTWGVFFLTAVLVTSASLPMAGGAAAGTNGMAVFSFEPSSVEAHPGETIAVDLNLRSSPQFANGAERVGVVVVFNESYVEATDIDRGPFMRLRGETTVETNLSERDNERGYVVYELERDPPNGGTYGYATFATLTFQVKETAPEGTFEIDVWRAQIVLTDGMYQRVRKDAATVAITHSGAVRATEQSTEVAARTARTTTPTVTPTSPPTTDGGPEAAPDGVGPGLVRTGLVIVGGLGLFGGALALMRRYVPATTDHASAHRDEPFSGTCPRCGDSFESRAAVRDHAWHAHASCYLCGATFDSREELRTHLDDHG